MSGYPPHQPPYYPGYQQQPQPGFQYQQPMSGAPQYGQPYRAPYPYPQQQYGAPAYQQYPQYGQPRYQQPAYQQPAYQQPSYQQPAYQPPSYPQPYAQAYANPPPGAQTQQPSHATMPAAQTQPKVPQPTPAKAPSPEPKLQPLKPDLGGRQTTPNITPAAHPHVKPAPQPARPGYLAPAEPPTSQYIPPPCGTYKFPFQNSNKDKYANLYSLLSTINALQEQASLGNIPMNKCKELTTNLLDQYTRVVNALSFNFQNVKDFADAAGLNCQFALDVISQAPGSNGPSKSNTAMVAAVELGTHLTTLLDLCHIEKSTVSEFQAAILVVRSHANRMNMPSTSSTITVLTQWITYLREKSSSATLTSEERRRLEADVRTVLAHISG